MNATHENDQAGEYVNEHYRKVAARWRARVTDSPFMQQLRAGTLPLEVLRTFFKNWGSYTIEINTVEAASYHKHISFFRKHRDLMARMAEKLADELIHPKPPGHVHVVVETAKALGITEDEIFLTPMLASFAPSSISKGCFCGKGPWRNSMPPVRRKNRRTTGLRIFTRP